ncbi:MAG: TerB family tellurite resistance protein [Spirochaetota bacterium]
MKKYRGKLFGAALGFSFGGPVGALIGTAVGHLVDSSMDTSLVQSPGSQKELAFITSLVFLLTGTARADGEPTPQEVSTIKNFFRYQLGYSEREYFIIEKIIEQGLRVHPDFREVCSSIVKRTGYEERLFLVRLNYQVAVSDGPLNTTEEQFIRYSAALLGIQHYDYSLIAREFSSYQRAQPDQGPSGREDTPDPYALLGLDPDCSEEQVHRAYRSLANKYHPDKVSHLGKEFVELATRKFNRIHQAYQTIKKQKNL